MAKRQVMQWLAPNERWTAHPMWYSQQPEMPEYAPFLARYSAALGVDIVAGGESPDRNAFLEAAQACDTHLLLDPDIGLGHDVDDGHVAYDEFIQVLNSPDRQDRLTLIYDQGYSRGQSECDFLQSFDGKMQYLRDQHVHAMGYLAHINQKVVFIWASGGAAIVAAATRRMQQESHFPFSRFRG